ncbi:HlyD family efflux transporter periplasmic adaptor subunit [Anaerofustis stercorihominis]|uniref:HlyD family secretion protein n=1 Tax=Anaerofustis stercorihominis TaxID=214853 RepID=A0A3E3E0T9_9FIRM|nr:HlyD family efflux transporter periplasmic adaptor subunit [Anaerofustis stercorihominis]MCQ4796186.1 hypothetical protein [Anaerofustis stercorihominis]RGD75162.1 hypothetical protein DW687_02230 [Anaerofustis stercorihominis]
MQNKNINRNRLPQNNKPIKKRRKKSFIRKRYKEIIIISAILVFFLFSVFHTEDTVILNSQKHITTETAESYIFTNSEYVDLKETTPIKFTVKEGQKVGSNTKLSSSYKIKTNKYINDAIKVIDWRLKNKSYESREVFFRDLSELEEKITSTQDKYDNAKSSNNTTSINKYGASLTKLKDKKNMMQKSMKYIFADSATLKKIKSELKSKKSSKNKSLTISNLNFSFTGNIYFSRTGYEEVLNTNVMGALSKDYFDYLKGFKPPSTKDDKSIIKIVNNQCAYVCAVVNKDTYVEGEKEAKKYNKSVKKNHDLKTDGEYYDYLLTRVDMLITYPTIKFEDNDEVLDEGYLINSMDYGDDKKVLVICLKDAFDHLINVDKTKLNIHTNEVNVFTIPKSAIIEDGSKKYVYALTSGNFKELVEVKVYEEGFKNVLLKPSENPRLSNNMEVITNPD